MAEEQAVSTTEGTDDPSAASSEPQQATEQSPTAVTSISRTPDGWQSTLNVSLQITSTWGEATADDGSSVLKRPDNQPPGSGSKSGLGVQKRTDNQPPGSGSKSGLGVEENSTAEADTTEAGDADSDQPSRRPALGVDKQSAS